MIGAALSSTFHGRDIFSPAAAHLVRGDDWTQVGPELDVSKLVRVEISVPKLTANSLEGEVIGIDGPFRNLITNISGEEFLRLGYARGQTVTVAIGSLKMDMPFVKTFSDVPLGKALLYIDSRGRLSAALNQGNFAQAKHVEPGQKFSVARKP
jgi:S-adenosylmethionine hydrolase